VVFISPVAMLTVLASQPNKPLSNLQRFMPTKLFYDSVTMFLFHLRSGARILGKGGGGYEMWID